MSHGTPFKKSTSKMRWKWKKKHVLEDFREKEEKWGKEQNKFDLM